MLGFIANFLLLSRSPAATIYETLFKQSKDKSKSKVAPIKSEDKENWLRKMEKPKINAFEHLRIGNYLLYLVIYFFRTDKQKKLNRLVSKTEKDVEKTLDLRSLVALRNSVRIMTKVLFTDRQRLLIKNQRRVREINLDENSGDSSADNDKRLKKLFTEVEYPQQQDPVYYRS